MLELVNVDVSCRCAIRSNFVEALKSHLDEHHESSVGTGDAPVIARLLVGSKQVRLGAQPDPERLVHLTEMIRRYMRIGAPIEFQTMWGATKSYAQFEHKGVDALDLLGLRRYAGLNRQVKALYPPGIKVRICQENITEIILVGQTDALAKQVVADMSIYRAQLRELVRVLQLDFIEIVDESDLQAESGVPHVQYLRRIRHNAGAFFQYWLALELSDYDQNIPEFLVVKGLGMAGPVTRPQWDHYINRVQTEYPNADRAERAWQAALYLSNAVTRSSMKFVHGTTQDDQGIIPPIRSSFVPYPPGTPRRLYMGRLEYKVKDSKHSKKTVAPWSGYGLMIPTGTSYSLSATGVRDYREMQAACAPVVVRLSRESRSVDVRADVGPH